MKTSILRPFLMQFFLPFNEPKTYNPFSSTRGWIYAELSRKARSWFSLYSVAFLSKCGVVGVKGIAGTDVWSVIAKVSQVTPCTISSKGNKETIKGAESLGKMNEGGVLGLCQLIVISFA
jgi:hypothetical protein